jgi:peptidoglycan-associated lipoprotein
MMGTVHKFVRKFLSVSVLLVSAVALTIACKSKSNAPDVGTPEGAPMDSSIQSKDVGLDAQGSDSGNIAGLHTVHFDYDQATLTSEARKELSENAEWIKAHAKSTIQIEGHCDKRGSTEYNLALGERRAKAVKSYMVTLGIDSKRMTVISYGEEKPLDSGDGEAAFAKNRRANFVPLGQ